MLSGFALLEGLEVKRFRLSALLTFNQGLAQSLDVMAALRLATDEVADRFTVIGAAAGRDLGV